MRFVLGRPPDSLSADELASGNWRRLKQPPVWLQQLLAAPVGLATAVVVFVAWMILTPQFDVAFEDSSLVYAIIVTNLLLLPVLQIAAHPPGGFFGQSVLGLWASRLTLYTTTLGTVTRRRYLLVLTLHFLLMALAPLLFVAITRVQSGWLVFASCVAAVASGWHLVLASAVAFQLPADARVGCVGFQVFWRN